jgi:hypothetical protein
MIAEGNEQKQDGEKDVGNSAYSGSIKVKNDKQYHSNDMYDRAEPQVCD